MEFLNELGSLVYFRKAGLSDIVILDPRWLTEVMVHCSAAPVHYLRESPEPMANLFNFFFVLSPHPSGHGGVFEDDAREGHPSAQVPLQPHLEGRPISRLPPSSPPPSPWCVLGYLLLLLLLNIYSQKLFVFDCAEKFQITFRLRRKRLVLRAVEDVTGRTQNQLSFKVGDKIMLLEKPKVGRWWKGMHNGQTGYFQANHVEDTGQPPEFTLEDESLVPCLLTPEPPPGLLEKEWPLTDETAPLQIGRVWRFSFLPLPFFPQVIVRLLHSGESRFVQAPSSSSSNLL